MNLTFTLIALSVVVIGALVISFRIDFIGKPHTGYRSAEKEAAHRTPTQKYNH